MRAGEGLFSKACSDKTRTSSHKLKKDLHCILRKDSLWWVWWSTATSCSEKWWMPHSWMCSQPCKMGLWVSAILLEGGSAHDRGLEQDGLWVSFQHKPFYDTIMITVERFCHQSVKTVKYFGVRGDVYVEMSVYYPEVLNEVQLHVIQNHLFEVFSIIEMEITNE